MRLLLPCVFACSLTLLCILVLSSLRRPLPDSGPALRAASLDAGPAASAGVRVWDTFLMLIGLQARCSVPGGPSRGALLARLRVRLPTRGHRPGWCPQHFVRDSPTHPLGGDSPPPRGGGLCAELPLSHPVLPHGCLPCAHGMGPHNGFRTELFRRGGRDRWGKETARRRRKEEGGTRPAWKRRPGGQEQP